MKMVPDPNDSSGRSSSFGKMLDTVLPVGLMVTIAFTALAHGTVEPWSVTGFSLIAIFLFALWMVKSLAEKKLAINLPSTAYPLAALFLLGSIQSLALTNESGGRVGISLDVEATRMAIEIIGYMLIISLIAANFLTDSQRLGWFRNFIIFFGLFMAVFGMVQYFTWNGKYFWVFEPTTTPSSPFGPFVNRNHFAGFMEMIAPIPLALILVRAVRGELALLYGFASVMMGTATIISLSRGGMISLLAGLLFVITVGLRPEHMRRHGGGFKGESFGKWKIPLALSRYGAAAIILLTIGVGIWWMGADPVIRRMEKGEISLTDVSKDPRKETFFQSRGWIWRDTMEMIRNNWVIGVGLGAYHTAYPIYSKRDGLIIVSQAHNDYLQALADGGIVAGMIVLWFILLVIRDTARAIRHRDPVKAGTALGCAGGIFALLVHSLFDFNLQLPSNALLFLVLSTVISRVGAAAIEGRVSQTFLERASRLKAAA